MSAVGCTPGAYAGGGEGVTTGGGRASVAFTGEAKDTDNDSVVDSVRGQFQFNDHTGKVAFHGTLLDGGITSVVRVKFDDNGQFVFSRPTMVGTGTYEPIPRNAGPGGTFEVIMADFGEPGPDEGDSLTVVLTGGVFNNYFNDVVIENGNLQKIK